MKTGFSLFVIKIGQDGANNYPHEPRLVRNYFSDENENVATFRTRKGAENAALCEKSFYDKCGGFSFEVVELAALPTETERIRRLAGLFDWFVTALNDYPAYFGVRSGGEQTRLIVLDKAKRELAEEAVKKGIDLELI